MTKGIVKFSWRHTNFRICTPRIWIMVQINWWYIFCPKFVQCPCKSMNNVQNLRWTHENVVYWVENIWDYTGPNIGNQFKIIWNIQLQLPDSSALQFAHNWNIARSRKYKSNTFQPWKQFCNYHQMYDEFPQYLRGKKILCIMLHGKFNK